MSNTYSEKQATHRLRTTISYHPPFHLMVIGVELCIVMQEISDAGIICRFSTTSTSMVVHGSSDRDSDSLLLLIRPPGIGDTILDRDTSPKSNDTIPDSDSLPDTDSNNRNDGVFVVDCWDGILFNLDKVEDG